MAKYKQKRKLEKIIVLTIFLFGILIISSFSMATPTGPTGINITANETKSTTAGMMVNISGGIISKLNISASVQNPHWKAFVGWIDGRFTLDDSTGSTIYDWTLTTVGGEVYATRESATINWTGIACANSTHIIAEDVALNHTGDDNITSTFTDSNTGTFVVAGKTIAATDCVSTNTYVNNVTQALNFEEVILYDNADIVFATILEEDEPGYDGNDYDFQMIVPERALSTWVGSTAYYLYVELS